jgi:hypothetical protein
MFVGLICVFTNDGDRKMNKRNEMLAEEPVETILGRCARPRPKLVCVDGRIVGDAVVIVSERDPNWWRGMAVRMNGEIRVRRL